MTQSGPLNFPYGARGIEVGDFAIEFRADKIVALRKSAGDHYTLHFGNDSGILDLHRTWRDGAGKDQHQTVFAMRREDIPVMLAELSSPLGAFFRLHRRLRLGWLKRHNIGVVWGLDLVTTEGLAKVTRKVSRRKRVTFDEEKWRAILYVPGYLEEVWEFPDGPFSLFQGNRRIGIGFKVTDRSGRARLFWVKIWNMLNVANAIQKRIVEIALRYAIPPERYGDYTVLIPKG